MATPILQARQQQPTATAAPEAGSMEEPAVVSTKNIIALIIATRKFFCTTTVPMDNKVTVDPASSRIYRRPGRLPVPLDYARTSGARARVPVSADGDDGDVEGKVVRETGCLERRCGRVLALESIAILAEG